MADAFHYHFEWDPAKAAVNRRRHEVNFEQAATVFKDPLALSLFDEDHSETQERWVTLGQAENDRLLVVVHTYSGNRCGECRWSHHLRPPSHQARTETVRDRLMKDEYDFSKGERGRFFRKGAKLHMPVYLDDEVQTYLQERARSKGIEVSQLVNEMLRQDIKLVEAVK